MEQKEKRNSLNFILPSKAQEIFLNPSNFTQDEDIIKNSRIISQIYDSICNLYESKKQMENYFPSEKEIYEDLEFRKKAITDKIPLPSKQEVLKFLIILAAHKPSFLLLLRELNFHEVNRFYYITKVAIPFNNNLNLIQNGILQVIHNSLVVFRNHYSEINTTNLLKQSIQNFNNIEELEDVLEIGQLYSIFKGIYLYKKDFLNITNNDLVKFNIVNQRIQEMILKPIMSQLVQEKIIVSIKRSQFDPSLQDILLINDLYSIELRYNLIIELIFNENIKNKVLEHYSNDKKIIFNNKSREEQIQELCEFIVQNRKNFHNGIFLLATEILSLKDFIQSAKVKEQIEKDKIELKELIKKLSKQIGFFRAKARGKVYVSERILNYILQKKVPNIFFATYPIFDQNFPEETHYEEIYLLLDDKNLIVNTFKQIQELFNKVQDIYLIRILEQMFNYHYLSKEEENKLFPAVIREDLRELISKSYLNQLPFIKRILYKITREIIDSKTLKNLWKKYYESNRLKIQNYEKKEKKQDLNLKKSNENLESFDEKDEELFHSLLKKINWYLERDKIPTKEILLHDFSEQKNELENLFKKISLGLKSYKQILIIPIKHSMYLLDKNYLVNNKENLIKKYTEKLKEIEGIEVKGRILSLKVEKENKELYQKILSILKSL